MKKLLSVILLNVLMSFILVTQLNGQSQLSQDFLKKWGGQSGPIGTVLDKYGNVFVADVLLKSIKKYSSSGLLLATWSAGGINNQAGIAPFSGMGNISVDADANLYVADYETNRVLKYTVKGVYVSTIGAGYLNGPRGVAVDNVGNIYVADAKNFRIAVFSPSGGAPIRQIGTGVSGNGTNQLGYPTCVALDVTRNFLFVVDQSNNRVLQFPMNGTANSNYTRIFGAGLLSGPWSVAIDPYLQRIWITDSGNNRIVGLLYDNRTNVIFGSLGSTDGKFSYPVGITIDLYTKYLYVTDFNNKRVQVFGSSCKGTHYGIYLSGIIRLGYPGSMGAFNEVLYIPSYKDKKVYVYNYDGNYKRTIGNQLNYPYAVAVDNEGNVYVVEVQAGIIEKFNSNGVLISTIGGIGTAPGKFSRPSGIAIDAFGKIYVTDLTNDNVQRFATDGTFEKRFSLPIAQPSAICVDGDRNIYVTSQGDHLVYKLDFEGNLLGQFGSEGSGNGQFALVSAITTDFQGNIYVGDKSLNRFQKFSNDANFTYQGKYGYTGTGDGQFNSINGLFVNHYCEVQVSDTQNDRVTKFFIDRSFPRDGLRGDEENNELGFVEGALEVSPNPSNGTFSIYFPVNDSYEISVYDMNGTIIKTAKVDGTSYSFSESGLSSGMYFVHAIHHGKTEKAKFIVQK